MQEIAKVVSVNGQTATVSIDKKDECSKCGMCLFPKNAKASQFEVKNHIEAKQGDTVLVEIQESGKLTALILVFLVPILLILVSFVLAEYVLHNEIWMLWLSLISVGLWFCVLPFIDKQLKKTAKYSKEIIKVLFNEKKENENE